MHLDQKKVLTQDNDEGSPQITHHLFSMLRSVPCRLLGVSFLLSWSYFAGCLSNLHMKNKLLITFTKIEIRNLQNEKQTLVSLTEGDQ